MVVYQFVINVVYLIMIDIQGFQAVLVEFLLTDQCC